jgi:hypothetical protein
VCGLIKRGAHPSVFARDPAKATALAEHFGVEVLPSKLFPPAIQPSHKHHASWNARAFRRHEPSAALFLARAPRSLRSVLQPARQCSCRWTRRGVSDYQRAGDADAQAELQFDDGQRPPINVMHQAATEMLTEADRRR